MKIHANVMKRVQPCSFLILFFIIAFFSSNQGFSQVSTANYTLTKDSSSSLVNMSTGTTQLIGTAVDDGSSSLTNIGFNFWFMGQKYTQFSVSSNGLLQLGSIPSTTTYSIAGNSSAVIAAFAGDQKTSSTGKVHYMVTGTAPNRVLVVEWLNEQVNYLSGTADATYQVLLNEGTGVIQFIYGSMAVGYTSSFTSYTGISNGTGSNQYATIAYNGGVVTTTSVTSNTNAASSSIARLTSSSNGSRHSYTFTPATATLTAPSAMSYPLIGPSSIRLKWADNSSGEKAFAIFKSIDSSSYTFVGLTNANDTAYTVSGLSTSSTYYFLVYAITEGAASSPLAGKATTLAGQICGTKKIPGDYSTITAALSDLMVKGVSCNTVLELQSSYSSSSETFPITINSIPGIGANSTVTIRPASGASSLSISGSSSNPIIDFNGAKYISIDGRAGGSGTTAQLTIENTSTSGNAIRFINGANYNTVTYCTIKSVNISTGTTTAGTILFGSTSAAGNSYNTISNNDIRDGSSMPYYAIYSSGSTTTFAQYNVANTISNNNIYNFFAPTTTSSGIYLASGNTDWVISGNSLYATNTLTPTSGVTQYAMYFSNSGYNFTITNNYIGGSAPAGGGSTAYTLGSTSYSYTFYGMYFSIGTQQPATSIQGNTITNFNFSTSNSGTAWSGIYCTGGYFNIGNITGNTIGATTGNGAITISSATGGTVVQGIYNSATTAVNISNNNIGSISVSSTATSGYATIYGIQLFNGQLLTLNNNTIGSNTTSNSITYSTASTATSTCIVAGIYNNTTSSAIALITNSTIANLNNSCTGSSAQVTGIYAPYGLNTITDNVIKNLSSASTNTSTSGTAAASGITIGSSGPGAGQIIARNTIFNISNSASSAGVTVQGIYYSGSTSGTNQIFRNFIHSLTTTSTSTSATITGINIAGGISYIFNNLVRLGIDGSGSAITNAVVINGILKSTTSNNYFYFNTVYIGGTGVGSGTVNTYAFRRTSTGVDDVRDNIFQNSRSNSSSGGKHYAYVVNTSTTLTSNYNIYYANGTGGVVGSANGGTTDATSLQLLRVGLPNQDLNSGYGDPALSNPTGTSATLSLQPSATSPVESAGIAISGITTDFVNNTRTGGTDIGAYSGNFTAVDIYTPVITYAAFGNSASTTGRTVTGVQITDVGTGVPTSGANVPRIWYMDQTSSSSWASKPGTLTSGNGTNGTWSFTLDYSALSTSVSSGDKIQYYIVAQDGAATPNVWYSPFAGASHSSVSSQTSAPTTPNSYKIISTSFSGTYIIGSVSGANYANLTGSSGFFAAINAGALSGNVTAIVSSDLTEDGTTALNQWGEDGTGGYTVSIVPDGTTERVISGSVAATMIRLDGADHVIIDGNYSGSGRYLRFRNTNTSNATIALLNDATNNIIRNVYIEGANTSTASADLVFSTTVGTFGNSNNTITNNIIRDLSSTSGVPANLIYSSGTTGAENANNTITKNEFFNYTNIAVNVSSTGAGNGWNVSNNAFYQTASRTTALKGISISGANGHTITANSFGGSSASRSGSQMVVNTSSSPAFEGISLTVGNLSQSSVTQNTFGNIAITGSPSTSFTAVHVNAGTVRVDSNLVGTTTNSYDTVASTYSSGTNYIFYSSGGDPVTMTGNTIRNFRSAYYVYGFYNTSGPITWSNNTIRDVKYVSASTSSYFYGFYSSGTLASTIQNNTITNIAAVYYLYAIYATSTNYNVQNSITGNSITNSTVTAVTNGTGGMYAIYVPASKINIVSNNTISGLTGNVFLVGIYATSGYNTISGNAISNLTSTANTTTAGTVNLIGIYLTSSTAINTVDQNSITGLTMNVSDIGIPIGIFISGPNAADIKRNTISGLTVTSSNGNNGSGLFGIIVTSGYTSMYNNMISLGNSSSNDIQIYGISDQSTGSNKFYFNTVNISGTVSSGNAYTYAFRKASTGITQLRDNIFYNSRSGGSGNHYAMGMTVGTTPENYWTSITSDYNAAYSAVSGNFGEWAGNPLSFSSWKKTSGGDANSVNSTLGFTSGTDAHLTSASCAIRGKGIAITSPSITTDIDGDTRAAQPTIGADELFQFSPIITSATFDTICAGATKILSANAGTGYTYQWRLNNNAISGATSSTYTVTQNGSYTVDVTTPTACTGTSAPKVVSFYKVTADAGPDKQVCSGSATTIGNSSTVPSSFGPFTYSWTPSTGLSAVNVATPTATVSTNTTYILTVTDARGCSNKDTVVVQALSTPSPSISGPTSACNNSISTYSTANNAGTTYHWSVTNGTVVDSSLGYSVKVRWGTTGSGSINVRQTITAGGCYTITPNYNVTINALPSVSATVIGSTTKCQGDSILLSAGTGTGFNYQWRLNGKAIAGATSNTYYAKQTGSYRVAITNANGCTDSSSASALTFNALPTATISASGAVSFCQGKTVTLSANTGTGLSYIWKLNGTAIPGATASSYIASVTGAYTVTVSNSNGCSATSTATNVTVNALPTAVVSSLGATTTRCQGDSVLLAANTATGYTYQWRLNGVKISGATSASYAAKISGLYKVVVTNSSGCIDSSVGTTVTINTLPTAVISTVSGLTTFCSGGSVTLGALSGFGYSYQWLSNGAPISGATSSSFTASQAGAYAVKVTNSSGCSATSSVTNVTVNALPSTTVAPYGPTTRCQGDSVILNANSVSGYTYQWRLNGIAITNATSSSYAAKMSGTYKVVVTNASGCTDSSSGIVVTINPLPTAKILASTGTSICAGSSAYLSLSATVSGTSYQWQMNGNDIAGATSSIFLASQAGAYTVRATNSNGCSIISNTINITVNALPNPAVSALGATTFCSGDSVKLITAALSGNTYQWQMDGVNIAGATNANITATQSGDYKVIVTNASGCTDSSRSVTITVNPLPSPQIFAFGPASFCQGGSVVLKGKSSTVSGLAYQWFKDGVAIPGATAGSYTATSTGSYQLLQKISSTGCSIMSNAIAVTANPAPVSTIQPLGNTTFCNGGNVVLYAGFGEGKHYYWFRDSSYINLGNVNAITATESGTYTLVTQDSVTGCSSTSKGIVITVLDLPNATIQPLKVSSFCEGASTVLHVDKSLLPPGNNSFLWSANGIVIPGATADSVMVTNSGNYTVRVTDEAGCANTSNAQNVIFNALPVVKYSFPHTVCAGSAVDFTNRSYVPEGTLTYDWTFGDGVSSTSENPSHVYQSAGKFKMVLYATSGSGCVTMLMDSIIVRSATKADFKAEHTGPRRFTMTAQDTTGAEYHWVFGDGMTATGRTAEHDYFVDGTYQVMLQVTNASGCVTTMTDSVSVNSTGIQANSGLENSMNIYPNPFVVNSNITYTLAKQSNVTLEVYDMLGQKVETICTGLQSSGKYTYTFDSRKQAIPSDVYFVKLRVDQDIYVQRLVRVQ
jgi:hypothetical protein